MHYISAKIAKLSSWQDMSGFKADDFLTDYLNVSAISTILA